MPQIFINYRRATDAYAAALLDELLSRELGSRRVFRAAKSIPVGSDYVSEISKAIGSCDAMLVVVGVGWSESFSAIGNGREDWVLREIREALGARKVIIPIVLSGASVIRRESLPEDLAGLEFLQYLRFDYRNSAQDAIYISRRLRERFPSRSVWSYWRRIRTTG
ncbi:toll/interleukin-1 receptor domain-containing protein [Kitasatospora sp. NPDC004614]|uniref:toll/interleukin-1 receptor domain-containing protein n=1 Tax=unclassified Kitasatospora TaxID=2633591 RepID=UPI00367D2934